MHFEKIVPAGIDPDALGRFYKSMLITRDGMFEGDWSIEEDEAEDSFNIFNVFFGYSRKLINSGYSAFKN